jgi:hypothetical protein
VQVQLAADNSAISTRRAASWKVPLPYIGEISAPKNVAIADPAFAPGGEGFTIAHHCVGERHVGYRVPSRLMLTIACAVSEHGAIDARSAAAISVRRPRPATA